MPIFSRTFPQRKHHLKQILKERGTVYWANLWKIFRQRKSPKNVSYYTFFKFIETNFYFGKCFFFSIEKRKDDSSPKNRVNSKQNVPKSSPVNSLDYGVLCPCCDRVFQDLSSAVSILMVVPSYFISCNYQFWVLFFKFQKRHWTRKNGTGSMPNFEKKTWDQLVGKLTASGVPVLKPCNPLRASSMWWSKPRKIILVTYYFLKNAQNC